MAIGKNKLNRIILVKVMMMTKIVLLLLSLLISYISNNLVSCGPCDRVEYPSRAFRQQPDVRKVYMRINTIEDADFHRAKLTKFASVFGIRVLGGRNVSDEKILHVVTILAELLDSHKVGEARSNALMNIMRRKHATLAIAENNNRIKEIFKTLPQKFECVFYLVVENQDEIIPHAPTEPDCPNLQFDNHINQKFDKTIGLASDFIIQTGYPAIYPVNSELGRLLSKAFEESKEKKWLNVNKMKKNEDDQCDKECEEVSFQSWALTSAMGVDSCTCRKYQIWKLCTPNEMKTADPQLYAALTQDISTPTAQYYTKAVIY